MKSHFLLLFLTFFISFFAYGEDQSRFYDDILQEEDIEDKGFIVLINTTSTNNIYNSFFIDEIKKAFDNKVSVIEENIQIDNLASAEQAQLIGENILRKYKNNPPRAVLYLSESAWLATCDIFRKDWKSIPVIIHSKFKKIPHDFAQKIDDEKNNSFTSESMISLEEFNKGFDATVIYRPFYIEENIKLMKTLIPNMKELVFINDGKYYNICVGDHIRRVLENNYPDIIFNSISSKEVKTDDMIGIVASVRNNKVILFSSWDPSQERNRGLFVRKEIMMIIYGVAKVPVFTLEDMSHDESYSFGGYFIDVDELLATTIITLKDIFDGKLASSIPSQNGGHPHSYMDYLQLSRYGINLNGKQADEVDAVIFNAPLTFYQKNEIFIWVTFALVLIILSVLYILLIKTNAHRKHMEKELDFNKRVISGINGVVLISDKNGKIEDVLESSYSLPESVVKRLKNKNFRDFIINEDDYNKYLKLLSEVSDNKITERVKAIINLFGKKLYVKVSMVSYDEDKLLIFVRDYTSEERERVEEFEYRKIIETILNNLPIAVSVKNMETEKYMVWNKKAEELWFVPSETMIDNTIESAPHLPKKIIEIEQKAIKENQPISELISWEMEGKEFLALFSKVVVPYFDKEKWILSSGVDVTYMAEKEKALMKLNNELAMVQKAVGLATWSWDINANMIAFDFTFFKGFKSEYCKKMFVSYEEYLSYISPEYRTLFKVSLEKLATGELDNINEEYLIENFNGVESMWVESFYITGEKDDNGMAKVIVGGLRMIDDRKKMESELEKAKNDAEESNRLKSAFIANMSHEIRTPLNAIIGFSSILADISDKRERKVYSEIIKSNNNILLCLINDILDISKIEAGTLEFIYTDVDVNQLLEEIEQIFRIKMSESPVELKIAEEISRCNISTDRNRLSQVITNLMTNAIKFTKKGSITLGYKVLNNNKLYFYVKDTGCGISPHNLKSIFGRFVKLDPFSQGTGIGLSISQVIINTLGGEIGVESEVDIGSTFWFTLPYSTTVTIKKNQINKKKEKNIVLTNKEKIKILVAEDNMSNYKLISSILSKKYELYHALNGEEAIKLFNEINPDLILMDIKMPLIDGYETTIKIREISQIIPIIAVTAYASPDDENRIKSGGFDDIVIKPVNPALLKEKIEEALLFPKKEK